MKVINIDKPESFSKGGNKFTATVAKSKKKRKEVAENLRTDYKERKVGEFNDHRKYQRKRSCVKL